MYDIIINEKIRNILLPSLPSLGLNAKGGGTVDKKPEKDKKDKKGKPQDNQKKDKK